jgi:hypothetical protein
VYKTRKEASEESHPATANFHTQRDFKSFDTAEVYLLYWTAMLMLSGAMDKNNKLLIHLITLQFVYQSSITTPSPLSRSLSISEPTSMSPRTKEQLKPYIIPNTLADDFDHATSITASMDYCLRADNGLFGVGPTIVPLKASIRWYSSQPSCYERMKWCVNLLQLVPLIQGNQLFKGLRVKSLSFKEAEDELSIVPQVEFEK